MTRPTLDDTMLELAAMRAPSQPRRGHRMPLPPMRTRIMSEFCDATVNAIQGAAQPAA